MQKSMEILRKLRKKFSPQAKQQQNIQRAAAVHLPKTTANFKT